MKLILHIGSHKTGSTLIQSMLMKNRNILIDHGYLYPTTGINTVAHHNIAFSITNKKIGFESSKVESFAIYVEQLISEINRCNPHTVILSSEEFISFNEEQIIQFTQLTSYFESVDVVIYIRNQVDKLESLYKFLVLWNGVSLTDSFTSFIDKSLETNQHDYYYKLLQWNDLLNNGRIIARNFHDELKTGLIESFIKGLTIEKNFLVANDYHIFQNASLDRKSTLLLRSLNRVKFTENREKLITHITDLSIRQKGETLYTEDLYNKVKIRFYESNVFLKKKFKIDLNKTIKEKNEMLFLGDVLTENDLGLLIEKYIEIKTN